MEGVNDVLRGHPFYPADITTWPAYGSTEDQPLAERVLVAHYYAGPNQDWYVAEHDPEQNLAFGYADLGLGSPEWGDFDLTEMEELLVNIPGRMPVLVLRDLTFVPASAASLSLTV